MKSVPTYITPEELRAKAMRSDAGEFRRPLMDAADTIEALMIAGSKILSVVALMREGDSDD